MVDLNENDDQEEIEEVGNEQEEPEADPPAGDTAQEDDAQHQSSSPVLPRLRPRYQRKGTARNRKAAKGGEEEQEEEEEEEPEGGEEEESIQSSETQPDFTGPDHEIAREALVSCGVAADSTLR